jgi:hypothetical protein
MKLKICALALCFLVGLVSNSYAEEWIYYPGLQRSVQKPRDDAIRPAMGTYRVRVTKVRAARCEAPVQGNAANDTAMYYEANGDRRIGLVDHEDQAAGSLPLTLLYRFSPKSHRFELDELEEAAGACPNQSTSALCEQDLTKPCRPARSSASLTRMQ